MKIAAALAALIVSFAVLAAPSVLRHDDGADFIRLFNVPCANDRVLARTPPQYRDALRAGEGFIGGKMYGMCWLALPDGSVGMVYEDGDAGRLPVQAFRPEVNT